jgi:hypothetical protein
MTDMLVITCYLNTISLACDELGWQDVDDYDESSVRKCRFAWSIDHFVLVQLQ